MTASTARRYTVRLANSSDVRGFVFWAKADWLSSSKPIITAKKSFAIEVSVLAVGSSGSVFTRATQRPPVNLTIALKCTKAMSVIGPSRPIPHQDWMSVFGAKAEVPFT